MSRPRLEDAIDAANVITAAITGAMMRDDLDADSQHELGALVEEVHAFREKLQAVTSSIGTGKIRVSRLPLLPGDAEEDEL